jgi:hypothetical protein
VDIPSDQNAWRLFHARTRLLLPLSIQANTVQANTVQANTVKPNTVKPNTVKPNTVKPNNMESACIRLST